jgi:hypothetical protein
VMALSVLGCTLVLRDENGMLSVLVVESRFGVGAALFSTAREEKEENRFRDGP